MPLVNLPARRVFCLAFAGLALLFLLSGSADAQILRRGRPNAKGGVSLPYQSGDGHGQNWLAYPATLQMQGNFPVYQQAGTVMISGQQPNGGQQQAHIDEKTNELIIDGLQVGQFLYTRRILFNTDDGYARVIDVIKNPSGQDQQLSLQLTSYINFGVQSSTMISDPKKAGQNLAWRQPPTRGRRK